MLIKRNRSQCLIVKNHHILMATHRMDGKQWHCLPGGGIEDGETPAEAALRELREECLVEGTIIKKTSEYVDPAGGHTYSFHVDIGDQTPVLGEDPEELAIPILVAIAWLPLDHICERDRAYLWAAGLLSLKPFANELDRWSDDISYPLTR